MATSCSNAMKRRRQDPVKRLDARNISVKEFMSRYASEPVILTFSSSAYFARHDADRLDGKDPFAAYLLSRFPPDLIVPVSLSDIKYDASKRTTMTLEKFLGVEIYAYLKDFHVAPYNHEGRIYVAPKYFRGDLDILNTFCTSSTGKSATRKDNAVGGDDYRFCYAGRAGTFTGMHHDVLNSYSWSLNIVGTKQWVLIPPSEAPFLFDKHGRDVIPDITDPAYDRARFPNAHRVRTINFVQAPGEIMYVPSGWFHQVKNLTDCISVNHNGLHAENLKDAWKFLRKEYTDARGAIVDLKDTFDSPDAFEAHVQIIMKANSGFNIERFLKMLLFVVNISCVVSRRLTDRKYRAYFDTARSVKPPLRSLSDISRVAGKTKQRHPECSIARDVCYEMLLLRDDYDPPPAIFFSKSKMSKESFLPSDWRNKLSNFSECRLSLLGRTYRSVEHGFQAAKYLLFSEPRANAIRFAKIFESPDLTSSDAKRKGGRAHMEKLGIALDISRWNRHRRDVMLALLRSRWHADESFRSILIETHRQRLQLVHFERSGARSFWGGCVAKDGSSTIKGRNELGNMLMRLRDEHVESRLRALRRVGELVKEIESEDRDVVRAAGQSELFCKLRRALQDPGA
eukprot:g179.t1